jgi:hypothetical protein
MTDFSLHAADRIFDHARYTAITVAEETFPEGHHMNNLLFTHKPFLRRWMEKEMMAIERFI